MSSAYLIRRLLRADVSLRKLNELFAEAFADEDSYRAHPPGDAYLEEFLVKEHVIALTASEGDKVVGGLVAYELDKFERARREIYIYDLAVHADHRRRGIATALISAGTAGNGSIPVIWANWLIGMACQSLPSAFGVT